MQGRTAATLWAGQGSRGHTDRSLDRAGAVGGSGLLYDCLGGGGRVAGAAPLLLALGPEATTPHAGKVVLLCGGQAVTALEPVNITVNITFLPLTQHHIYFSICYKLTNRSPDCVRFNFRK